MVAGYTANAGSFTASKAHAWSDKQLNAPTRDTNFDLAPDGTRIEPLIAQPAAEETIAHVTFLLNFFDELRRRVPAGK